MTNKCSTAIPQKARAHVAFCKELPLVLGGLPHTVSSFLSEHYHNLPRVTYFAQVPWNGQRILTAQGSSSSRPATLSPATA